MAQTLKVESQGTPLSVQTAGRGAPVVFLHAAVCDRRMWAAQMDALLVRIG